MSADAYIGLGANLGEAKKTLQDAIEIIKNTPGVVRVEVSPFYASDPVDANGPVFVNAVARIQTSLAPLNLLDALQRIETHFGRDRPYRNAPRTLDLDLLLYDDLKIDTPRLTIPHPRMHQRAFVLQPLRDLMPSFNLADGSLQELLQSCEDQKIWPLQKKDPTE